MTLDANVLPAMQIEAGRTNHGAVVQIDVRATVEHQAERPKRFDAARNHVLESTIVLRGRDPWRQAEARVAARPRTGSCLFMSYERVLGLRAIRGSRSFHKAVVGAKSASKLVSRSTIA